MVACRRSVRQQKTWLRVHDLVRYLSETVAAEPSAAAGSVCPAALGAPQPRGLATRRSRPWAENGMPDEESQHVQSSSEGLRTEGRAKKG